MTECTRCDRLLCAACAVARADMCVECRKMTKQEGQAARTARRRPMNRLTTCAAVLAVLCGASVLAAPTNRVRHTHCILIGEGLETTAGYQFVTPWGRCTITHEEWEVLNRVIRRAGANAQEGQAK